VLGDKSTVLLLQGGCNLFRVLRVLQVLNEVNTFHFVDIIEASTTQKLSKDNLRALESRDAFLQ
jgi:hypothetical protein